MKAFHYVFKRLGLFVAISLFTATYAYSQNKNNCSLYGYVLDSLNLEKIPYATIRLYENEKLINGTITDSSGYFCLNDNVKPKFENSIKIDILGYEQKKITLNKGYRNNSNMGEIKLKPQAVNLSQIEVVADKKRYETLVDRTVLIPDSLMLKGARNSLDLMRKIPMLDVNKSEGTASIRGKGNVLLLVDGMYKQGVTDLNTIAAEEIEKIEIITSPSAAYSSEVDGVINIILKEQPQSGYKFYVNIDYPVNNKYNNSSGKIDYTINKIHAFASYRLMSRNVSYKSDSYTKIVEGDDMHEYYSTIEHEKLNNILGHIINYGVDYNINKYNQLGLYGKFEISENNQYPLRKSEILFNDSLVSEIKSHQHQERENYMQNYSLYYSRKFDKENQKLTINSNVYLLDYNKISQYSDSIFSQNENFEKYSTRIEKSNDEQYAINIIADYKHPVSSKMILEIGGQTYYRDITNSFNTNKLINDFDYADTRNALYSSINMNQDKFGMQAGIRFEQLDFEFFDSVGNSLSSFLPNIGFIYKPNKNTALNLNYTKNLKYPRYSMLKPFEYYSNDSLSVFSGNPNLLPEAYNQIEFSQNYRKKSTFIKSGIYSRFKNRQIAMHTTVIDGVKKSQSLNLLKSQSHGLYCYSYFLLLKLIQVGVFTTASYNTFSEKEYNGLSYELGLNGGIMLPGDFVLNGMYNFKSKNYFYQGYEKSGSYIEELYLVKSILKDKGEITLSLMNFFIDETDKERRWFDNYEELTNAKYSNKEIKISFFYFFKSGKKIEALKPENLMESD